MIRCEPSAKSETNTDEFKLGKLNYCHFSLSEKQAHAVRAAHAFGDEQLLHDTYYDVQNVLGNEELNKQRWLRCRRDVNKGKEQAPEWALGEMHKGKNSFISAVAETCGLAEIAKVLGLQPNEVEGRFPKVTAFRFFRRTAFENETRLVLDETSSGFFLGVRTKEKVAFDAIWREYETCACLFKVATIEQARKQGKFVVSEHLYGDRLDCLLEGDAFPETSSSRESESIDDDDSADERFVTQSPSDPKTMEKVQIWLDMAKSWN